MTASTNTGPTRVFVQLRCRPGTAYDVADRIYEREIVSELYSTSGEWDLFMIIYIPSGEEIGRFINDKILDIPNIDRSLTTLTFKAF
ncbi:MAG: Lrp/AsnC family transcriptional regulator [Alphaproteobacteria bacterium]|nr:Lrp/AsnC family transcriptional regulator [Alphaproteobacteria bacterium]